LCDRDIATNFGAVAGEVILVDSCACTVIFICYEKKRETEFSLAAAVLFKTEFFVTLGINLLFAEVKRRSEQD